MQINLKKENLPVIALIIGIFLLCTGIFIEGGIVPTLVVLGTALAIVGMINI